MAFRLQIGIQTGWEKIIINQKVSALIPDLIDIPRLPVTMMIDLRVMKHLFNLSESPNLNLIGRKVNNNEQALGSCCELHKQIILASF